MEKLDKSVESIDECNLSLDGMNDSLGRIDDPFDRMNASLDSMNDSLKRLSERWDQREAQMEAFFASDNGEDRFVRRGDLHEVLSGLKEGHLAKVAAAAIESNRDGMDSEDDQHLNNEDASTG
ncbi:hypothetical protein W97_01026 [Coniosporium apollinis CBS 100218]|uniref:Uncharacterized protein n=1 Tax=Coniosporium apollinis (strain CBS 100218) TaxID=1168221 RepID=R7YJ28_CONA1|nr:uncharacterized protein W97_01026 [Coniosporium apollinis CBS 100218]EON61809.1 hypothetical protein W97_01026 [Coniosporium apollinis CBS 100218]